MAGELVYNLGMVEKGEGAAFSQAPGMVVRQNDNIYNLQPTTPQDYVAQYPIPLDTTELVVMCEEIGMWRALPEKPTALKAETWRELNQLAFSSGSSYVSFADGACPEEYYHDGSNTTTTLKNIGAHKSLEISDIMQSAAIAAAGWNGINKLIGGFQFGEGMPGGNDQGTFLAETVADLKAKEMALAGTLVLNGWDRLLVSGNAGTNALEFSGIQTLIASGTGAHYDYSTSISGTFSAASFDRFLSEGCAKPTALAGHPQAIQELMSAYFALGFNGSQLIFHNDGSRVIPGYNFAGEVNTGIGLLKVIADRNFTQTTVSTQFQSDIFALRLVHNGEPLIYKATQIPFSFRDLVPGCTSIQFEIWAKTALIVKAACAHGAYRALFSGRSVTTCPKI